MSIEDNRGRVEVSMKTDGDIEMVESALCGNRPMA